MTDEEQRIADEIAALTLANQQVLEELVVLLPVLKETISQVLLFSTAMDTTLLHHYYGKALIAFAEIEHELSPSDAKETGLVLARTLSFDEHRIATCVKQDYILH